MKKNLKPIAAIAIVLTSLVSEFSMAQSPTLVLNLLNLKGQRDICYYTWAVENNSTNNFTSLRIDFTPYDAQGYAMKVQQISELRLPPNGKGRVENITFGSSCDEIKGIKVEGINHLTEANGGFINVKQFNQVFKFIFNGKPVNVKAVQ